MAIGNARRPLDTLGEFFSWRKDKDGRYRECSESYAEAAGVDSPEAIIGKTDFQLAWRKIAHLFVEDDAALLKGIRPSRLFSQEKEISAYGPMDILVSERPVFDRTGQIVGVSGHFQNITGHVLVPANADHSSTITAESLIPAPPHSIENGRLRLCGRFNGLTLTEAETDVLRYYGRGYSSKDIGKFLGKSHRTVEVQCGELRAKLGCSDRREVMQIVVSEGLDLTLFKPRLKPR